MCIPKQYRDNDMFDMGESDSPPILDVSTDSSIQGDDILNALFDASNMANIQMITCTLAPQYQHYEQKGQYSLLVRNIENSIAKIYGTKVPAYYCVFELTKSKIVHSHMLIDVGYEQIFERLKNRLMKLGFIFTKKVFDFYGVYTYIMKDIGNNSFPPIHSNSN